MTEESGRVLVVDDNRMNRLKLSLGLEQQGQVVSLAENGQQALDMLEAMPFDVILLDIVMPGLDGFEVLRRVKANPKTRDIPVIVISALDETESAVRCIENGAEDYLPKAFNPILLRARINSSLQKKKLRDLEKAYLRQEVTLRQSEKLVTLGRLSAGLAHELNNPAAAAQRGAAHLQTTFSHLQQSHLRLGELNLIDSQLERLLKLDGLARERATQPADMDSLTRSDREYELETWLDQRAIDNSWELAPTLVKLGYSVEDLANLIDKFSPVQFLSVIAWLNDTYVCYSLLEEIGQGTRRITEIVTALKDYSYLDQAPIQNVNVHKGLDDTLIILRSKLRPGITVRRDYAADLPDIQAYGSELNQVWTNIIDNAIDAMNGKGKIVLRTRRDGAWAVVSIEDTGPGIPESIRANLFDPFFTTKEPGKGTGLGLNISHNIIQKHKGSIDVSSRPGTTRFDVRIPLTSARVE
ncbi:MAG TPA: response regulator [Chloroflexota bacterium]|nr:response regulator [Chloroflexota bacterium]